MEKRMNKMIGLFVAVGFLLATGLPALADVNVYATIDKDKDKDVDEDVYIDKAYFVTIEQNVDVTNSGESETIKNDRNEENDVYETDAPNNATIENNSFDGSTGVVGVNQSPGSENNQGNATGLSVTTTGDAFLHSEASVEKINTHNYLNSVDTTKTDTIETSFNNATNGIIGVNQAAGHMNNQDNAVAMSLGLDAVAALSETDLGMTNSWNYLTVVDSTNTDKITGAFLGANGMVGVNQSSGSMNNQANVVSIAATEFIFPFDP